MNCSRLFWEIWDESNNKSCSRTKKFGFFEKLGYAATVSRRTINSEWYKSFVCQLSSNKFRKPSAQDGSLFTNTMQALTRLKQLHFWAPNTSNWWSNRHIVSTPLYFRQKKNKVRDRHFSISEEAVLHSEFKNLFFHGERFISIPRVAI